MCLAIPGRIIEIIGSDPLTSEARVDFDEATRIVSLALLPDARVGDHVLVHVGFAISRLDEAAAERVWAELERLSDPGAPAPHTSARGASES